MKIPFLDFNSLHDGIVPELIQTASSVIQSGWFVNGGAVTAFESEWSKFLGTDCCVGVNSGLDALELSLRTAGIGNGDEVIVPSNTRKRLIRGFDMLENKSVRRPRRKHGNLPL